MIYLSFIPLILAIYLHAEHMQCAYVNMSISSRNIKLNESITITQNGMNPTCCADVNKFELHATRLGASTDTIIAAYDRRNIFTLPLAVDAAYKDRVFMSGDKNVTISPVTVADEKTKYFFVYQYFTGPKTTATVESTKLELQNVYALPVINSTLLKEVTDVNIGEPNPIICAAKSRPASKLTWSYDAAITGNSTQSIQQSGYYYITTSTFYVTNPSKTMNGKKVTCNATHQFGSPIVRTTTLHIQYKPDNIQFTSPKLKPVNGNNVALTCSSTGVPAPKYRIYKIIRGTSTLIVDSATGNYTITRISYADYGGYNATIRCIPHNSVGDGPSKDLHLDIQVPAMVDFTVAKKTITENDSTTIECNVAAANPPTVASLKDPQNKDILLVEGVANLTRIKRASSGVYICTANNQVGSPGSKTATITVQYKPDPVTFTSSKLELSNGSSLTLTCASDGKPAPSYKFESIVGSKTETVQDSASGRYSISHINYATYSSYSVSFRCTASNTLGSATSKEVNLNITDLPNQTQVPDGPFPTLIVKPVIEVSGDIKIKEGSNVTFRCRVTAANPDPVITWRNSSNNAMISHSNGVVKLTSVSTKQTGNYACHAKNSVGEVTKIFTLTVTAAGKGGNGGNGGTGRKTGKDSSNTGAIVGAVVGIVVLLLICFIIYFLLRKGSPLVCGRLNRLNHEKDVENKENEYMQMEGVSGNKNNKIADAYEPEESPRVNESASKEPILPAPGAEKADQYTERYVLDNGTEYSTVVTRGKDHMPGVDGAKKAPEDKDKSKEESHYAEFAAFNVRGNVRSPSDKPEPTQYATLEECGPIVKDPPTGEYENVAQIMGTPTEI